jgi:hypothetical protein
VAAKGSCERAGLEGRKDVATDWILKNWTRGQKMDTGLKIEAVGHGKIVASSRFECASLFKASGPVNGVQP